MFKLLECTNEEKEYLSNIHEIKTLDLIRNMCTINYFGKKLYFYKVKEEVVGKNDCWVNYTGLSSNRPKIIIDHLINKGILVENMNILDIGCGLSEIGVEIRRQLNNVDYNGLDINNNLLAINRINFADSNNYKFTSFDLTNTSLYNSLDNSYDIVMACGAATEFYRIFQYTSNTIKPKYIICESHIGRNINLINIINSCKNYKILNQLSFQYKSTNGPIQENWIGYKRHLYVLEKNDI